MNIEKNERHLQGQIRLMRVKADSLLCSAYVTSVEKSRNAGQAPGNFIFSYQPA